MDDALKTGNVVLKALEAAEGAWFGQSVEPDRPNDPLGTAGHLTDLGYLPISDDL